MIRAFKDEYRWLSNFMPCRIFFDGSEYPSVEHAYVAAKTDDAVIRIQLTDPTLTAGQAKRLGKALTLSGDWPSKKYNIMKDFVRQKFNQEPYRSQLIATGDEEIQEGNTWGDVYFGVDLRTGEGQNNLGELIMMVRRELQAVV